MGQYTIEQLKKDIEIPDMVNDAKIAAFQQIWQEEEKRKAEEGKRGVLKRWHPSRMAACIAAGVLVCGTLTVGATAYFKWSRGLEQELQVSEKQKAVIEESGLVNYVGQSVTNDGVTVTAEQSIIDNYYGFLAFKVEGYSVEDGHQPAFRNVTVTIDGEPVSNCSGFYDGFIAGEDGKVAMADGSALQYDEEGGIIAAYTMEDGSLEYHIYMSASGERGGFFGKQIHVEMEGVGTYPYHEPAEDVRVDVEGTWSFDWTLSGADGSYTKTCDEPLGDSGAKLIEAEVSPISLRVVMDTSDWQPDSTEPDAEPPWLTGVKLKDGTMYTYLYEGPGNAGYVGDNRYEIRYAIDRILDINQVESLLFIKSYPEGEGVLTEENLYEVKIR